MKNGFTKSFSVELLQGIHDFRTDAIKVALYGAAAAIDDATATYTATGEIGGAGYTPGGAVMGVSAGYPMIEAERGAVRFEPAAWPIASTFSYRKILVYNATKANRSILVFDYGSDRGPTNGAHFISTPLSSPPLISQGRG